MFYWSLRYILIVIIGCFKHNIRALKFFTGSMIVSMIATLVVCLVVYTSSTYKDDLNNNYISDNNGFNSFDDYYRATLIGNYVSLAIVTLWQLFLITRTRSLFKYYESE